MNHMSRRHVLKYLLSFFVVASYPKILKAGIDLSKLGVSKKLTVPICKGRTSNMGSAKLNNFKTIFENAELKKEFSKFLIHVYGLYPEKEFLNLISTVQKQYGTDRQIYEALLVEIPKIKPFLQDLFYALPSLTTQKEMIRKQTQTVLKNRNVFEGYLEIGTPGRYIDDLKSVFKIDGETYLMDFREPGYGLSDIMERGSIGKVAKYLSLKGYCPISSEVRSQGGVGLISMYIGLHHIPREGIDAFVTSIRDSLKSKGVFVLRDHDVTNPTMDQFVGLVHDVFNAGLLAPWKTNESEQRFFMSAVDTDTYLEKMGFKRISSRIAQEGDPSKNLLMAYEKV